MNRSRKAVLTVSSILVGVVLAVGVSELVLRLIGFQYPPAPPTIQFGWPDPVELERRFERDPDLMWVSKDYTEKLLDWKDRRPSVVFLGDSCTQFSRYDQRFAALVAERRPGQSLDYVNLAVAGWSSYQGLRQLERDILPLRPRIVTIYFGWNDHWKNFGLDDKGMAKLVAGSSDRFLGGGSLRIVQFVRRTLDARSTSEERDPPRVTLDDFANNLTEMVRMSRAHDIEPVLITAPSSHRHNREPEGLRERHLEDLAQLVPLHARYVQAVLDVASREDVLVVDLYAAFNRLPPNLRDVVLLKDGIHLSDEGETALAGKLYGDLERTGLLELILRADDAP